MQHIRHRKVNGNTIHIHPGLGAFRTPADVQDEMDAKTDDELVAELHKGQFIDPFVMGEIMARGIYYKVTQPKRFTEKPNIAKTILRMLGDEEVSCTCHHCDCGPVYVSAADVVEAGGHLDCEYCGQPMETKAL